MGLLLILVSLATIFVNCKKDEAEWKNGVTATVGSNSFSSTSITSNDQIYWLTITAVSGDQSINIMLPTDATPGQYNIPSAGDYSVFYAKGGVNYISSGGTFNLKTFDVSSKTIEGTFECNMVCSTNTSLKLNLTSGSLKYKY